MGTAAFQREALLLVLVQRRRPWSGIRMEAPPTQLMTLVTISLAILSKILIKTFMTCSWPLRPLLYGTWLICQPWAHCAKRETVSLPDVRKAEFLLLFDEGVILV